MAATQPDPRVRGDAGPHLRPPLQRRRCAVLRRQRLDGRGEVRGYQTDSGKTLWRLDVPETAIYALAGAADGKTVAAAGTDGRVRLIDAATGKIRKTFLPVTLVPSAHEATHWFAGPDLAIP